MVHDICKLGEDVLARRADDVDEFGEELRALVADMFETMYEARGVGLAAPQIGVSKRLFVMDCAVDGEPPRRVVMANPEILETAGTQSGTEGCLSIPGIYSELERPGRVRARGQREDGTWFEVDVEGLEARCVLHECDHLDGKLYIDRLGPIRRDLIKRKVKKLKRGGEW